MCKDDPNVCVCVSSRCESPAGGGGGCQLTAIFTSSSHSMHCCRGDSDSSPHLMASGSQVTAATNEGRRLDK